MVTSNEIISIRESLGENQKDFAKRFGVDQSTIHRWETIGVSQRGTTASHVERVISRLRKRVKAKKVA